MIGTYEVDAAKFNEGLQAFRADNFVLARDLFPKPTRNAATRKRSITSPTVFTGKAGAEFPMMTHYFKKGLEQTDFVIQLDKNFKAEDENLKLQNPVELKNEIEEGLKVTAADFNPLKVLRERK